MDYKTLRMTNQYGLLIQSKLMPFSGFNGSQKREILVRKFFDNLLLTFSNNAPVKSAIKQLAYLPPAVILHEADKLVLQAAEVIEALVPDFELWQRVRLVLRIAEWEHWLVTWQEMKVRVQEKRACS